MNKIILLVGAICVINFSLGLSSAVDVYASDNNQYKHYKEEYKNKTAKEAFYKVKTLKKGSESEENKYRKLKKLYNDNKKLSSRELRKTLTSEEYNNFKLYKKYKGYKKYKKLNKKQDKQKDDITDYYDNFLIPVKNPFVLTMDYGNYTYKQIHSEYTVFHNGLDLVAREDKNILATFDGTVINVEDMGRYGYGRYVAIQHDFGVVTVYGHLSEFNVSVGDIIKKGAVIGKMGNTETV